MNEGEEAMRNEGERLVPLIRSGGFISSVDHETPPHVPIDPFRVFRRLLAERTVTAV